MRDVERVEFYDSSKDVNGIELSLNVWYLMFEWLTYNPEEDVNLNIWVHENVYVGA